MTRRAVGLVLGVGLVLVGTFLPRAWYDDLPRTAIQVGEQPIKGVTLLQICFVLEGLVLVSLASRRTRGAGETRESWPVMAEVPSHDDGLPRRQAIWILAGVTVLGLALRLYRLDADLWLDEITPIAEYGRMSLFHIVTSYVSSNNHLLNTLLVKGSVAVFGPREWAIRLPAVVFGTATVPAIYWLARSTLTRAASLAVALLLALSYHHVFFSQNARGYTAYLFFSLVATALLLRALRDDRQRDWALYVGVMVLNFASILISLAVFLAHILVGAWLVLKTRMSGGSSRRLWHRLAGVAAITGFLGFHLYATILPQVYVLVQAEYVKKAVGYELLAREHASELVRGISAGLGVSGLVGVVLFLLVVAGGFVDLSRRHPVLALTLVLPEVLTAVFLVIGGLQFTPRFFLLAVPLGLLSIVFALEHIAGSVERAWGVERAKVSAGAVALLCVVSLASLTIYYGRPKQDFRAAIRYVEANRASRDLVLPLYLADWGYWFYGERFGLVKDQDYFPVRSVETLETVLRDRPHARTWVVMTFPRAVRLSKPELFTRIQAGWTRVRTFPGTVGDGDVSVWVSKPSAPDRS